MSLTGAARRLGVPKSKISRALTRLEEDLRSPLMVRSTRRLALTPAGEAYLEHAERAVEEAEHAERAVAEWTRTPAGHLRAGMPPASARAFVGPMLPGFLRAYPSITVELVVGGRLDPVKDRLDVVLHAGTSLVAAGDLKVRRMGTMQQALCAAPSLVRRRPKLERPEDLSHWPVLAVGRSGGARWVFQREARQVEVRLSPLVSVADPYLLDQLTRDGAGAAVLPEFLFRSGVSDGSLVRLMRDWASPAVELHAVYAARPAPQKLQVFLEAIETSIYNSSR